MRLFTPIEYGWVLTVKGRSISEMKARMSKRYFHRKTMELNRVAAACIIDLALVATQRHYRASHY